MIDFKKFLDLHYLFAPYTNSGLSRPFQIGLLALFVISLAVGIVAGLHRAKSTNIYKRGWRRWQIWGWSNGLVGLLLVAFRESRAAYLGSRVWLLLWLLIALLWLLLILKYWLLTIPAKNKEIQKTAEFNKWLPNK